MLLLGLRVDHRDHFAVDKLRGVRDNGQSQPIFIYYEGLLKVHDDVWDFLEKGERVLETLTECKLNFISKSIYIE
jgi:hypothetical protein